MWKEYASTIGKTADTLTIAEKRQAEYAGIMKETQNQIGDAAKYAKELSGAQAKAAAETLKLQQAMGGAMAPTLQTIYNLITPIISATTSLIQQNPILAGTIISMVTTLAALATGIMTVTAALKVLKPAITAVTGLMATNPVLLAITVGLVALVGAITLVTSAVQKAKKAQEEYTNALKEHDRIVKNGISKSEIPTLQEKVDKLKELSRQYDEVNAKMKAADEASNRIVGTLRNMMPFDWVIGNPRDDAQKYSVELEKIANQMKEMGATRETVNRVLKDYETAIREASRTTAVEFNEQAKSIAQKHVAVVETQNLISAYKSAEKGSKEWYDAQKSLAEQFPQFSSAAGIEIGAIESLTTAQQEAVKAEWAVMKARIVISKQELASIITNKTAAIEAMEAQMAAFDAMNEMLTGKKVKRPIMAETPATKARRELEKLKEELKALGEFENIDIESILGIKPIGSYTSYENKALESALKILDHKKRMNQLTEEDEIKTLESILRKYARTADEKMDIDERLYDAKQALRDREKAAIEKAIEDEADKLAERTERSMRWIEDQKLYDTSFGAEDEIAAYNRVIKYHKDYLNKVIADKKISEEEKQKIIYDETKLIQDQQRKIYEIQKSAVEKAVNEYIAAKQKQYDTEERLENERLNKKLSDLEKEYRDRENAVKASERATELADLYEQERRFQNAATKEGQDRLKSIRGQISDLTKEAEQDRLQEEKEARKTAIEDEIKTNKDKYQTLRDDLLEAQKSMTESAMAYAKESSKTLQDSTVTLSNSLQSLFGEFDKNNTNMMAEGLKKLRNFVNEYKKLMESITLKPNMSLTPAGAAGAAGMAGGVSVTVNDYGDKNINSKDEAVDYTKELFNTAENAARQWGGSIG